MLITLNWASSLQHKKHLTRKQFISGVYELFISHSITNIKCVVLQRHDQISLLQHQCDLCGLFSQENTCRLGLHSRAPTLHPTWSWRSLRIVLLSTIRITILYFYQIPFEPSTSLHTGHVSTSIRSLGFLLLVIISLGSLWSATSTPSEPLIPPTQINV
jgi:hypothetical protein